MTVADATSALGALGREAGKSVSLAGSMSGSAVYRVDLEQGEAILKVTRLENGVEHLAGARRELDFYLTLAHRVPVRTARLLDHLSTDEAVILLLGAHHPAEPAASWDDAGWLEVARDLAALHDWPPPADPTWQHGSLIIDALGEPDLDMAMAFWSQPGEAQLLKPMFDHPEALAQAITAPTECFLHGDCHAGNLLRHHGTIVWVDWQAAGVGSPASDLAFPSVRAVPDGALLPHDAMLDKYAVLRGLDPKEVGAAVLAAELSIFVLSWPRYAGFNTVVGIQRVHARVTDLARAWNAL